MVGIQMFDLSEQANFKKAIQISNFLKLASLQTKIKKSKNDLEPKNSEPKQSGWLERKRIIAGCLLWVDAKQFV